MKAATALQCSDGFQPLCVPTASSRRLALATHRTPRRFTRGRMPCGLSTAGCCAPWAARRAHAVPCRRFPRAPAPLRENAGLAGVGQTSCTNFPGSY